MKKKKVALGLSGGVDSAVSAKLLLDQGYEVTGVYLVGFYEPGGEAAVMAADARRVAEALGMEFRLVDLGEACREQLRTYFYQTYQKGRTPNICSVCNREIKFGAFYEWAMGEGYGAIATGHYARTKYLDSEERLCLYTAKDKQKDQTYFLALVTPSCLERVIFPVGGLAKNEVRELARGWGLPVAEKAESQDICFFQGLGRGYAGGGASGVGKNVSGGRNFLREKIAPRVGKVKLVDGTVIGEHAGVELYTVGQRHGLKIRQDRPEMPELYVLERRVAENEIIAGTREEAETDWLMVADLGVLGGEVTAASERGELRVRVRHRGELVRVEWAQETAGEAGRWRVKLAQKVFAPSPGQFAVFYLRDGREEGSGDACYQGNYYCLGGVEIGEK